MTMADLVALGAPPLPRGFFYRVKPGGLNSPAVQVRRESFWGSRLVSLSIVQTRTTPTAFNEEPQPIPVDVGIVQAAKEAQAHGERLLRLAYWKGDHQ